MPCLNEGSFFLQILPCDMHVTISCWATSIWWPLYGCHWEHFVNFGHYKHNQKQILLFI